MAGYLSQIAAAVPAASAPVTRLRPFVRSRSPIAELDQRMSSADWGTPLPPLANPAPVQPDGPFPSEAAPSHPTPARVASEADDAAPPRATLVTDVSAMPIQPAGARATPAGPASRAPLTDTPPVPSAFVSSPRPTNFMPPLHRPVRATHPAEREPGVDERTGAAMISPAAASAARRTASTSDREIAGVEPAPRGRAAPVSATLANAPRRAPNDAPAQLSPPHRQPVIPARSTPHEPSFPRAEDAARSIGLAAAAAFSPEAIPPPAATGPRVIIDRLQIDVVPPPSPAAPKPALQPERGNGGARPRGPVSQIGPLSHGTTARHSFALRYR